MINFISIFDNRKKISQLPGSVSHSDTIFKQSKLIFDSHISFTPLKIYNGTPEGVPLEIQWQQLPINESTLV